VHNDRRLYLIRHAIAHERGDKWPDDTRRPLTQQGIARMRVTAQGLVALRVRLDAVITSPFTRAQQTAEIVAKAFESKPPIMVMPALAPGGSAARVAEALASQHKAHEIALVGHEPDLGELASWFLGARHPLPFKKGGICCIHFDEWPPAAKQGALQWVATPRMLRGLG
jgi:phosphohistidine phosphatase